MEEPSKHTAELETKQPPVSPTTTHQEDLTTQGQRRINLIWEYTQAAIALLVAACTMMVGILMVIEKRDVQIPTIFAVAFGTVIGFYFGRTNHTKVGGIGVKDINQER